MKCTIVVLTLKYPNESCSSPTPPDKHGAWISPKNSPANRPNKMENNHVVFPTQKKIPKIEFHFFVVFPQHPQWFMTPHQSWEGWSPCFWGDFARPSRRGNIQRCHMIVATENTTGFSPKWWLRKEGKWDPGYFRKIAVGEIL